MSDLSRRTVLRAATRSAWAVPLVTVATAAPAYAAVSNVSGLSIDFAQFYVYDWGDGTWGVVPMITVSNQGSTPIDEATVQLEFPVGGFTGVDKQWSGDGSSLPPVPGFQHSAGLTSGDWSCGFEQSSPEDTSVQIDIYTYSSFGAHASVTFGAYAPGPPMSLDWANDPAATSVSLTALALYGSNIVTNVGSMTRVDPPATS